MIKTTDAMSIFGVCTANVLPYVIEAGAVLIVGRVAALPSELNRYAG